MTVLVALALFASCVATLSAQTAQAAAESAAIQASAPPGTKPGPDYTAFVKNGRKPVVTPLDKMTPSSVGVTTEISPPIQEPNCYQPPAGFNPATATHAERAKYGYPDPSKGEPIAHYMATAGRFTHRVCVSYQTNHAPNHTLNASGPMGPLAPSHAAHAADINTPHQWSSTYWAGNVADQQCGLACYDDSYLYSEIDADWHIACLTINTSLREWGYSSAWVGIGGDNSSDELVQAGSEMDQKGYLQQYTDYYLWYEYIGNLGMISPREVDLGGPNGNSQNTCGDHVYARVYGQLGQTNCYELGDIDNGTYWGTCTGPWAGDNTAEGIIERSGQSSDLGLAQYNNQNLHGIGATDYRLGYQGFPNLWHDYYNMDWNSGRLATTSSIQSDPNDYPYDYYGVQWVSACGGQSSCL